MASPRERPFEIPSLTREVVFSFQGMLDGFLSEGDS